MNTNKIEFVTKNYGKYNFMIFLLAGIRILPIISHTLMYLLA